MSNRNAVASVLADATTPAPIDWTAVEELSQRLGPRTQGLARVHNLDGLRCWLAYTVQEGRNWPAQTVALYREMAELVGVIPSSAA